MPLHLAALSATTWCFVKDSLEGVLLIAKITLLLFLIGFVNIHSELFHFLLAAGSSSQYPSLCFLAASSEASSSDGQKASSHSLEAKDPGNQGFNV